MATRRPLHRALGAVRMPEPSPPAMPPWLKSHAEGAWLRVVVVPNASHSAIAGLHGDALRIRVAAVPVDGRANDALLEYLARALDVPRRALRLDAGHGTRAKRVVVAQPPGIVHDRLRALLDAAGAANRDSG